MSGNSETTPLLSGFEDTIIEIPRDERRSEPQASIAAISVLSNTDLLMQIEEYLMGDRKHRNTNAFLLGAWQLRSTCIAIKAASDNYPAQIQLPFHAFLRIPGLIKAIRRENLLSQMRDIQTSAEQERQRSLVATAKRVAIYNSNCPSKFLLLAIAVAGMVGSIKMIVSALASNESVDAPTIVGVLLASILFSLSAACFTYRACYANSPLFYRSSDTSIWNRDIYGQADEWYVMNTNQNILQNPDFPASLRADAQNAQDNLDALKPPKTQTMMREAFSHIERVESPEPDNQPEMEGP